MFVAGCQCPGDIDIAGSIEILEVSTVPIQKTEYWVYDAGELAYATFGGSGKDRNGRKTDNIQIGHFAPIPGIVEQGAAVYGQTAAVASGIFHRADP